MVVFALVLFCGLLGLCIGSFLNVVIARVPEGRSVVKPRSSCPNCGHEIAGRDNIPVVSWLLLGRRCRGCRTPISARYPIVELLTATLYAVTAWVVGPEAHLVAILVFVASGVALSAIDIDCLRLPIPIVYTTLALVGAALLGAAATTGSWREFAWAVAGGAIACATLLAIHVAVPRGMGLGDVRLALVLGAVTGWFGPARVGLGLFLGFLVGSIVGIAVSLAKGWQRKRKIPFGPSLIMGAYLAIIAGAPIMRWYRNTAGL